MSTVPYPCLLAVTFDFGDLDEEGLERWYTDKHLKSLSELPIYRRSQRYLSHPSRISHDISKYLAIHEFENMPILFDEDSSVQGDLMWMEGIKNSAYVKDVTIFELERTFSCNS